MRRRRRTWLPLATVTVPAAAFLSAAAGTHQSPTADSACCAELVAAAPAGVDAVSAQARYTVGPSAEESFAASRAALRIEQQALPVGVAPEQGLQVKTILAARAVSATFPEILRIGGVRPDSLRWHPEGLAIDVMIPNYHSAEGKALGDQIVAFVFDNADQFALDHVIWQQTYFPRNGSPRLMADYGSDNANHYNHVHIATTGGGYPTGGEIYLR